jgi:hypothetical protein
LSPGQLQDEPDGDRPDHHQDYCSSLMALGNG